MRNIINAQMKLGEIPLEELTIELNNRDDIPAVLRGLQYIYTTPSLCKQVFTILGEIIPPAIDKTRGRTGMTLWQTFVLGTIRLTCNCDYDRLQELANNHITLRSMLGHSPLDRGFEYHRSTLNDNLRLFTPTTLNKINTIIAQAGISLLKAEDKPIVTNRARCDSFVLETDVHFPTDLNLLWDATRKTIELCLYAAEAYNLDGWRQGKHNLRKIKRLYRLAQKEREKDKVSDGCLHAVQRYIDEATILLNRGALTAASLACRTPISAERIMYFVNHGKKQIDQIVRRCFKDETIPHDEKVFSLFEPYTEWISKGKAGIPQELGLRVCIMESNTGFILHHKVMKKETDDAVAVPMVEETLALYSEIRGVSFDKGFHSPANQERLGMLLDHCVLPRKGKLTESAKEKEHSTEFIRRRREHSAVESAINALEQHGLDRCLDLGIEGFERYVSLAIVARNIHKLGSYLRDRELLEQSEAA